MSLILDAINKSEQQRPQPDTVPGVEPPHDTAAPAEASTSRRLLWPVLTAILALLVIVLWLDGGTPAPVEDEASPPVQAASPAQPEPAALPPMSAPEPIVHIVASSPASPVAEPPAGVDDTIVAALYAPVVAADDGVTGPVAADIVIEEIEVVEVAPAETANSVPEDAPLDVEAIARAAQKALEEPPAEVVVVHAVPLIGELKQRTKDEIPSIFYSSHHWSTVAAERVVTLNGQAHREGERIKPGLSLVEILEDSIVLDYRGTEFRLRSLNSWVNL